MSPETQVAFNLKKGSLPVRGDIDLAAANDCMQKGLDILAAGNLIPSVDKLLDRRYHRPRSNDVMVEFFNDPSMTPEDAQARFAQIIANARVTRP